MSGFQQMWDVMKGDARSERHASSGGRYSEFRSPSHANALIDHVVRDQDMQ